MKSALPAEIQQFRSLIRDHLGLSFEDNDLDRLSEVLHQRIASTGATGAKVYMDLFRNPSAVRQELRSIAPALTTGETYFFRHPDHFRAFSEVALPERLGAKNRNSSLKILSAACATGEEAYTLAYLVREQGSLNAQITAADVNATFLAKAAKARYSEWSLRDMPEEIRQRVFRTEGREFVLDESLREMVSFVELNLAEENPVFWYPESFDVIFCRNLLIYFSPEATRMLIDRLMRALVPGGFLFLGPSETLRGISQDFHLKHTHATFYYQKHSADELRSAWKPSEPLPIYSKSELPLNPPLPNGSWIENIQGAADRIEALAHKNREELAAMPNQAAPLTAASLDRALILLKEENFSEAINVLASLPAQLATDPDVQILRAVLLISCGQVAEAEEACLQILSTDEMNAGAHYLKALVREHKGERVAAIEQDRMAIYLNPDFAMPHMHLGLLSKRTGDISTARRELSLALTLFGKEDASRILLFGGGFSRDALLRFCDAELRACGRGPQEGTL